VRRALVATMALLVLGGAARAQSDDERGWRPFLFTQEGRTVAAKRVGLEAGAGYNGLPALRSGLPANQRRVESWVAGGVGLHDRVELLGTVAVADGPERPLGLGDLRLDLRVRVLGPFAKFPVAIAVGVGYQLDPVLASAITGTVALSSEVGRFQLAANVRLAHYFAPGRDAVDITVTAAATVRVVRWLRLGVEYVGDELEAAADEEEADLGEAGGRHYVGPSATLLLQGGRMRIGVTAGPLIVGEAVSALGRASISYLF